MARADDRLGIYERLGFAIIIGWRLRILHERDEKKMFLNSEYFSIITCLMPWRTLNACFIFIGKESARRENKNA